MGSITLTSNEVSLTFGSLGVAPSTSVAKEKTKIHPEVRKRKWQLQRRSANAPSDHQTPREQRAESPNPTLKEMRWVLSHEEVEAYIEHWRAGKEFRSRLHAIERGVIPTGEEVEQLKSDRRSFNEARRMQEYVKGELVRSNRARPKMVESYENRLRSLKVDASTRKERKKYLMTLVNDELASPDEVEEYEKLLAYD